MHRNCILFLFLLLPIILCDAAPQKDHSRNRIRRKGRPGVYCREPGVPAHGSSLYNSIQAGAIVVHSCDPGYMLVGAKLRLCQTNGQWSPSIPNCILVDCGDPGEPTNGAKWVANTFLGSVAKYTCDKGFTLSGNLMRVCQRTGRWSGSLPSCVGRSCRDLPPPANGNVFIQDNRVGSLATYSCSSGFTLIGNRTRVCGSDGIWRGRPPICRRVSCGQLGAPEKGRVNLGGLTVGSIATYECFQGYTLVGVSTRTCQPNGQWTGRQPFCQGRNCARLVDIQNGRVSFSSTSVGSVATYICNQGFELIGSSRRTCQSNGQWSGREPVCTGLRCGSLSNIENGRVSFPSTSVGSVATYTCNRGFELIGSSRRTCQSNGQWSGREPVCTGLRCRSLSNIENGRVSFSSTSVGSVATYTCNRGFELIGSSRRTCQSNRQWSSVEPFCRIIGCERLQPPLNGVVSFPSTTLGSVAVYSCNRGFELVGVARRTCQIDGTWSGIAPTCSADVKRCNTLSSPSNGQVFVTGTSPSSLATYICNRGFTLQGNRNRVCQATGLWSGEEPTCTRKIESLYTE